jgi:Cu2+-exporting ATPase
MNEISAQLSESEVQVVHATPGRVRLRTRGNNQITNVESLAQQLRLQNGIDEVRINSATNSLVVSFDENKVFLPQMLDVLQTDGKSEARGNTKQLSKAEVDTFLQPQTEGHLSSVELAKSIIPLASGMVVTAALGIEGFLAFPVFIIAESVTREVIKQFDSVEVEKLETPTETSLSKQVKISQDKVIESNGKSATFESNGHSESLQLEVAYQIVHAIPGRIRFRLPRLAEDAEYAHTLKVLLEEDTQVKDVRLNSTAASIAISYELGVMSDEKMQNHLIKVIQTARKANIPRELKAAETEEESEKETNIWSQLALPAFTTTLALLGGPLGVTIPPAILSGTIAITALPVAKRALDSILAEHRLNIDFLDLAAITITTLQGQFISPSLMILLVEAGEAIREQTARSSKLQTLDLLDSLKQFVWVERNGEKQEISIHEVEKGDIVIVYPGDQIPVDGHILRGKALIDEQKLTGESLPVMRRKGQAVYTSTLVREGQLYIRTENVGADTRAGQIIKVMQDAPVHDTRIENYAANIADKAVVPTLLLSGIVFSLTGNFARAASILTLDFATGIRVSVPTTVLAALTNAARRGILIRSGRALEKLAQVDAVVFDKTGTLTQGKAVVVSVETEDESITELQVLELAAAAEQRLTHPVAEAIVRYAQEQGARILPREKWDYQIGLGVQAKIEGQNVLVGSEYFLRQQGINLNGMPAKYARGSHSVIYVASNGKLQGAIAFRDPLRLESQQVIKKLQSLEEIEIHLLTGDNQRTAKAVADELGITETNTHAEAFPEEKVAVVERLHSQGKTVTFVGDGINDSPALAYADVSISFAEGSDVARETADVVLMENNLHGLPEAIAIARQAMQLIHQNTAIVAVPNLAALGLAVAVGINPLAATLVNNGSAIVAGVNGLRPLLKLSDNSEDLEEIIDNNGNHQDSDNSLTLEVVVNGKKPDLNIPQLESLESLEISEQTESTPSNLEPLTGNALAHRLNVSATTISKKKLKPEFPEWSRSKDPDGIAWEYSKKLRHFVVS